MIELKPCPICGCTSYFYSTEGRRNQMRAYAAGPWHHSVHCSKNCVSTKDYETQEEAARVWNERT